LERGNFGYLTILLLIRQTMFIFQIVGKFIIKSSLVRSMHIILVTAITGAFCYKVKTKGDIARLC
jgi:hypothetical protein